MTEVEQKISELSSQIKVLDTKMDMVYQQTTQTNGRVKALEIWKAFATGYWKGILALGLIVGAFIGWAISLYAH